MRIPALVLALTALLIAPHAAFSHGTERHYGDPFGKRPAAPPSPAFSMMLIDNSLSAIRRALKGQSEDSLEERLESVARSTAALLHTTARDGGLRSEFAAFADSLQSEAPRLRGASKESALSAVEGLKSSFEAAKRLYETREQGG